MEGEDQNGIPEHDMEIEESTDLPPPQPSESSPPAQTIPSESESEPQVLPPPPAAQLDPIQAQNATLAMVLAQAQAQAQAHGLVPAQKPRLPPDFSDEEVARRMEKEGLTEQDLPENYKEQLKKAFDFARQWQQRHLMQNDQSQLQAMQEAAQLSRTIALSCRIYVGNIIFEVSQDDIQKFFSPFGFIKVVDMSHDATTNKHKGYCFVEYEVPEAAAQAIKKRNGATLGGRSLKVNRPSNYNATLPNGGLPAPYPERVYVANVHEGVSEKDLREVFEAFGAVKACVLVPDPIQQKHKGYGFIEYEHAASAEAASLAMDDFDLGGKLLCVTMSGCGVPLPPGMDQMPAPTTKAGPDLARNVSAILDGIVKKTAEDSLNKEENVSISGNSRYELMQKLSRDSASRTMLLKNMVTKDELDDEFIPEVAEECFKFGDVKNVKIHTPEEGDFVKVFVQFSSGAEAAKAIQVFEGRFYGGHRISAQHFDNAQFESGDFD